MPNGRANPTAHTPLREFIHKGLKGQFTGIDIDAAIDAWNANEEAVTVCAMRVHNILIEIFEDMAKRDASQAELNREISQEVIDGEG